VEAREPGGVHASALRRAVKRREALSLANPYTVATVGFGETFLYCNGVLCYTIDDTVRVLDLHHSDQHEVVISIPVLLTQCLTDIEDDAKKGLFQILYYSNGIISCVYSSNGPDPTAWLIAFSIKVRMHPVVQELDSMDKIFIRHNKQYLYYGTHSEIGVDGYKKWVIHGYDFKKRQWFDRKVHLPDMVGSEIGSTICFEFYNEYFYALSNQTSFEVEEIDWTSFYHCVRFPLASPCMDLLEKTDNHDMWRRQHQEGPIDDRWTSLKMDVDEGTGELKIVESRKEWAFGSSRSRRTYYTTRIIFPEPPKDEDIHDEDIRNEDLGAHSFTLGSMDLGSSTSSLGQSSSSSSSSLASSTSSSSTLAISELTTPPSTTPPRKHHHDLSILPFDPLTKLLRADDNPHHMVAPPRKAWETHPGDDGSTKPTTTLARCRIRSYHTLANTFLDLVDDPLPSDWRSTQRLRLRAGSRQLGPPLTHPDHDAKAGLLREAPNDLQAALDEMYHERPIQLWPAAQDPNSQDADLDAVYSLLNPPSHLGNVDGTADERSMVYVTGGCGKPQAIIFVGFDPGMKLAGLKRWGGLNRGVGLEGVGEGPHIDGHAAGGCGEGRPSYVDVEEADRTVIVDRKGKGREVCATGSAVQIVGAGQAAVEVCTEVGRSSGGRKTWAWKERAMYLDIGLGFYFGLEKRG
jgi:hypothetical protein